MSYFSNQATEIEGKIATLKTIFEKSVKKYNKNSSDVNNLMDAIMEIFGKLGGYNEMVKTIENILSTKLDDIEEVIKSAIKTALKQIISCGTEPSIGDDLILTGVTFDIKAIDPMSILTIDPTSEKGSYAYFDNLSGIDSRDFNVFLYTVINKSISSNTYSGDTWYRIDTQGTNKVKTPLLKASFKEYVTGVGSNQLTIKISESYRGEKISYFISEYLGSIKLFNNVQILSSIFDDLLGSQILSINKTTDQLAAENYIKNLVDKILNNVDSSTDVIDESFYIFSNDTYNEMLENSEKKRKGIFTYNPNEGDIEIDQNLLLDSLNGLKQDDLSISEQTKILTSAIDNITQDLVSKNKVKDKNSFSFKLDFINNIITKLTTTITMFIFSPKIVYLFSMTSQIFGFKDEPNMVEFIKKNINIYKIIIMEIRDVIIQALIDKIKEMLAPMIAQIAIELVKEKFAIYKAQLDGIKKLISASSSTITSLT